MIFIIQMKYGGGIRLVLQTSVNLLKLRQGYTKVETARKISRLTNTMAYPTSHYSDEDLPESPESSPDEDFGAKNNLEGPSKERTGKKIISLVERAAQSSFFQKAAKLPKVAKLIEDVSSTPLILNVEVEMLEGPITVNIPPPPSDRLWYGFRRSPLASIKAVPQVGDRSVDMTTVSDWIESKLLLLIEKNLVCPNMDDIILPVMSGNELIRKGAYNH
ncbi:SMP-LTD domain-containing protein [Trichostrongylus colubriformis]|uniref:SMP-LTD domain-containing protein n=1 Tax=Trichostrongylus colubriformis TaxID=6319 RepID=A0AAN8IE50_TRICO